MKRANERSGRMEIPMNVIKLRRVSLNLPTTTVDIDVVILDHQVVEFSFLRTGQTFY